MSKVQPDVVVFDDRPLLVEATVEFLRRAPGIGRVAGTADESALFAQLRNHADLLLLWVDHTGGSSIAQILKAARQRQPRLSVLVVDPTGSHPELVDVLVGASVSVIDGDRSADALVAAIRQVASGHVVVQGTAMTKVLLGNSFKQGWGNTWKNWAARGIRKPTGPCEPAERDTPGLHGRGRLWQTRWVQHFERAPCCARFGSLPGSA